MNEAKHGVSLAAAGLIEWNTALVRVDSRKEYGEKRFQALGLLDGRLYLVAFTVRGDALRIISMRKANTREERRYEQA
ncbi:BrnT family toxin [Cupriavidus numazuensis]|uniref:BrnT family toxin n=1 Tax=Cupriavidus numazuensis TaxID=221992 RepID=UPI003613CF19